MSDRTTATKAVERELRIDASPETVYGYFVEPDLMMCWMGTEADLDPRPGGGLRVNVDGWDHYLPRLGIAATGADPGPDRWQDRQGD